MQFERLADSVHTLYAELLDQALAASRDSESIQSGSFVSKTIGGATYWYIQRTAGAEKRQTYLGRETPELLEFILRAGDLRKTLRLDEARRSELVRMLAAGGAARESGAVVQILRILAASGIFRGGGVLVGTQAFTCYANMLGVRFDQQSMRTADIDIACDAASGNASTFTPPPGIDLNKPTSSLTMRGRALRVRFLTSGESTRPVRVPLLGIAAKAQPDIDYLASDAIPAVVIGGSGVLVNVPEPARFALFRLSTAKTREQLRQAATLLEVLLEDRPADITAAWRAAETRRGFAKSIRSALKKLPVGAAVEELL